MSWADIFSLLATVTVLGGLFYTILFVTRACSDVIQTANQNLKSKGYDISKTGVSVKTSKRFDHEHYVDAVQRGFIRALGASSYGANGDSGSQERRSRPERSNSLSNVTSPYRPSAPVVGHVALPVKRSTSAEAKKRWVHPFLHEKS